MSQTAPRTLALVHTAKGPVLRGPLTADAATLAGSYTDSHDEAMAAYAAVRAGERYAFTVCGYLTIYNPNADDLAAASLALGFDA